MCLRSPLGMSAVCVAGDGAAQKRVMALAAVEASLVGSGMSSMVANSLRCDKRCCAV